jgi:hypothetical protein
MGISDPDFRKKLAEARRVQYKHLSEKQKWHWWRRMLHRLQQCPICRPEEDKTLLNPEELMIRVPAKWRLLEPTG